MQNSYFDLSIKSNSSPNLVLKLPIILEHLFLSATINNTLPSTKLNLSLSNCLTLSSKNLSKEDLNPPSTTLIYPNTLCNPLTYSSNILYQELDLSILSTLIHLTTVSLNGAKSLKFIISLISSIIRGFLRSGLSLPYFNNASLYLILLNGKGETSLLPNLVNTS